MSNNLSNLYQQLANLFEAQYAKISQQIVRQMDPNRS